MKTLLAIIGTTGLGVLTMYILDPVTGRMRRAEEVPGFEADISKPSGETIDLLQRHWAPSTRFLIGTAGAALALLANRRTRNLAPLSALVGLGCLFYGVSADGTKKNRKVEEG